MNLIKVLFITLGLTLTANIANAQQKVGSVNTEEVFASLSEVKTIGTTIDNLTKSKQTEIEKLINDYQTKLKTAQDKEKTLSPLHHDNHLGSVWLRVPEIQPRQREWIPL